MPIGFQLLIQFISGVKKWKNKKIKKTKTKWVTKVTYCIQQMFEECQSAVGRGKGPPLVVKYDKG